MIDTSPLHKITLSGEHPSLWIKRDDLLHAVYGGNKWRKLAGVIDLVEQIRNENQDPQRIALHTMGGAHSNHLYATAGLAHDLGIAARIIVRESNSLDTPTLRAARRMGAEIERISRSAYRDLRHERSQASYHPEIGQIWLPEGGAGAYAQVGLHGLAQELTTGIAEGRVLVILAAGTGTTVMALDAYLPDRFDLLAYPAGKGFGLRQVHAERASARLQWVAEEQLYTYGSYRSEIAEYIGHINQQEDILLDPIYTAPTLWHTSRHHDMYQWHQYDHVVYYHSGGTQALGAYLGRE